MQERLRDLIRNQSNIVRERTGKASFTMAALVCDLAGVWVNTPSSSEQTWWLKPLVVVAVNTPLGLVMIYQWARTSNEIGKLEALEKREEILRTTENL